MSTIRPRSSARSASTGYIRASFAEGSRMFNPDMSVWQGRVDSAEGPLALRWHQRVTPLVDGAAPGVALVGFACDEGVRRNQGRPGAADGPQAIRRALAYFSWHQPCPVLDAGDVTCRDEDLETAQEHLAAN